MARSDCYLRLPEDQDEERDGRAVPAERRAKEALRRGEAAVGRRKARAAHQSQGTAARLIHADGRPHLPCLRDAKKRIRAFRRAPRGRDGEPFPDEQAVL